MNEGDSHNKRAKTEIEAKFICPDGLGFDTFIDVVNTLGVHCSEDALCFQADDYLDTQNYTLLNSDAALRIRKRGENYVGAYKLSQRRNEAIFERKEFEWILSDDEIKLWNEEKKPTIPREIMDILNLQGQTLRKVLTAETQRHTTIISGNDEFKAEVSFDEVIFRGHKGKKQYREIEVELLEGQFEQFKEVIQGVQNHLKLQPAVDSKYKQGMILVGKYGTKTPSVF